MASMHQISKKLIMALNLSGHHLLLGNKPFIGFNGLTMNYYTVMEATWDDDKHKFINKDLYASVSMNRIVLFLRDMWLKEQGKELPTDNEWWNNERDKISRKWEGR